MKANSQPIVVEEIFNQPINVVWDAITNFENMKEWFFNNIPDFKLEVGFETKFTVSVEDRNFTHLWKIVEVIPYNKIKYNWRYKEYPGDSFVSFELSEENGSIKLRLISEVVKDFPDDIPEFKRESGVEGWNYFIKGNLKKFLDN